MSSNRVAATLSSLIFIGSFSASVPSQAAELPDSVGARTELATVEQLNDIAWDCLRGRGFADSVSTPAPLLGSMTPVGMPLEPTQPLPELPLDCVIAAAERALPGVDWSAFLAPAASHALVPSDPTARPDVASPTQDSDDLVLMNEPPPPSGGSISKSEYLAEMNWLHDLSLSQFQVHDQNANPGWMNWSDDGCSWSPDYPF